MMKIITLRLFLIFSWQYLTNAAPAINHWVLAPDAKDIKVEDSKIDNEHAIGWERQIAYWTDGLTKGVKAWDFKVNEISNGYVGLITADSFRSAWDSRGLFYGGDLYDGAEPLTLSFGPLMKKDDVVRVIAQIKDDKIDMYVSHNGDDLGKAFSIRILEGTTFYPAVSLEGLGSIEIKTAVEVTQAPKLRKSSSNLSADIIQDLIGDTPTTAKSIEGIWKLETETLKCEELVFKIPESYAEDKDKAILTIGSTGEVKQYEAVLTLVNTIHFPLSYNAEAKNWATPGPRYSTNHDSTPEQIEFERWMISYTDNPMQVVAVEYQEQPVLFIASEDCRAVFKRAQPEPVTKSPFEPDEEED